MAIAKFQPNRNSYNTKQSNSKFSSKSSTKSNNKSSSAVKGVGTSIQKNPIRDTNFFVKTNTSTATKVNVLEKGLNGSKPKTVFRIDGPHNSPPKATYPHLNVDKNLYPNNKIYQSLNHKPISNATYTIAKNYDKIGKYAKIGGRALSALAIATDAKDIYDSYKSDGNKIGEKTVVTSAGVAGSWTGGVGGTKVGAMGGAAIGSAICPGPGTVIGGAIGGIIGGISGAIAGKEGGEAIAKTLCN